MIVRLTLLALASWIGMGLALADDGKAAAAQPERRVFFVQADADRNGTLDQVEFRTFINLLANAGHSSAGHVRFFRLYSLAWATVDQNKDGVASLDELRTAKSSYRKHNKRISRKTDRPVFKPLS